MSNVQPVGSISFDVTSPVLIVGAGAAGLCAALAASEMGAEVVVIERDPRPAGSTALSAGLIPAAGTRFQRARKVEDSPALFAADIKRKSADEADDELVQAVTEHAGALVEWLADAYKFPFELIDDFNYPGHSALRMHGLPSRTGGELMDRLRVAVEKRDIPILCNATATTLFSENDRIHGVEAERTDGSRERIGCNALILACSGYGGNPDFIRQYIPEMADALYFGHQGNRGDALAWGRALGADLRDCGAYQGHGSVATPQNILITWAVMTEGGFQINAAGRRFSNEMQGYSEQAAVVLQQPGGIAFDIFDERIAAIARQFQDFKDAEAAGAVKSAGTIEALGDMINIPLDVLATTLREVEQRKADAASDEYGRAFLSKQQLSPPYYAVRVTGALFHTQGGLMIDRTGRVRKADRSQLPNLFAAGGAAVGVSGSKAAGYLSGNGLLTATVFGRLVGKAAAGLYK
ncbi:MAG TPA: FAD-dependent oxidoreductase [Xanthobacteraceae bacterium]|nr:FAD-dependent oxidoreductase [Xanthobacteraceae bacterium]